MPYVSIANDLTITGNNHPGIRFQIEVRSLPDLLYVLLIWICDAELDGIALDQ
jgi:hypothetical protein